ncbi:hypothetical protein C1646_700662 [Rhizophagus diaphanus]|nr:hypothetical protein C1646_700662 [Rhizophagus diaphanus] [Rhizophagus sp. MUCL 43196]
MSNVENNTNRSVKDDTNAFSELITAVRDVRDNADRFLGSLVRFDNIRHEVNIGSLNNFIQGILNTDYDELEEVIAAGTSSTSQQSSTPTTITTAKTSPLLTESFTESLLVTHRSQSDFSLTSQDDRSDVTSSMTTTTNSATIPTSKISFKRQRGRPRKFSNNYVTIIDEVAPTKSGRRSSQKNASNVGTNRIIGKSTSSSEIYYSDTSDSSSVLTDSSAIYSSDDDSHLEKVMNLVRTYISTTKSNILKDGIYTWKNTRPIFVNEHLIKVKKLFRNNNIPSSTNEDDDIINAFKRIHTSRRSMYLTRQKCVHTNSNSNKSTIINVVNSDDNKRNRGRPPKSNNNSSKGKQSMR